MLKENIEMTVFVHYNGIFINRVYCDKINDEGSAKTLRLSRNDELITSFSLRRIESFKKIDNDYQEYYLNIVGTD